MNECYMNNKYMRICVFNGQYYTKLKQDNTTHVPI